VSIRLALLPLGLLALLGCRDTAAAPERTVLTPDAGDHTEVRYSPDGKQIAYVASQADKYAVWTAASDGSDPKQVGPAAAWIQNPRWSPDGQSIAFGSDAAAPPDVWAAGHGGGRRLTSEASLNSTSAGS
jgi:Tol biopolymer transport system component